MDTWANQYTATRMRERTSGGERRERGMVNSRHTAWFLFLSPPILNLHKSGVLEVLWYLFRYLELVVLFTPWQHIRSYQYGYCIATVHTHTNFILADQLEDQATGTMTWHPVKFHYPVIVLTSPCPIPLALSVRLCSDKYQLYKSLVWLNRDSDCRPSAWEDCALSLWPIYPALE